MRVYGLVFDYWTGKALVGEGFGEGEQDARTDILVRMNTDEEKRSLLQQMQEPRMTIIPAGVMNDASPLA